MNYYIADCHFGHKNILAYDNRPFKTIEEHDEAIIKNWQNTVKPEDDVYILGDFSWYDAKKTAAILQKLPGMKHLIIGNHDQQIVDNANAKMQFIEYINYKEIKDGNDDIVLCHYPIPCFKNQFHGWYHFYGHVHISFEAKMMEHDKFLIEDLYGKKCNMLNVGCMMPYMNYSPRTFMQLKEYI